MARRYDKSTQTLWVSSDVDADSLVDPTTLKGWSSMLRSGETDQGEPLKALNVVFSNPGGASYNHQPLAFSQLGTFVGTVESPRPFDAEDPEFETREDFGIES